MKHFASILYKSFVIRTGKTHISVCVADYFVIGIGEIECISSLVPAKYTVQWFNQSGWRNRYTTSLTGKQNSTKRIVNQILEKLVKYSNGRKQFYALMLKHKETILH